MLENIAVLTGANPIMETTGKTLESVTLKDLGITRKVVVAKENTTIVEGSSATDAIQGRIAHIRAEIEGTKSDYDKQKLQERLAKLSGGVAQINVGAATEAEMREKKARVEDALHATRAAVEGASCPAAASRSSTASTHPEKLGVEGDELVGSMIIRRALEAPMRHIAANAGQDGAVVVQYVASVMIHQLTADGLASDVSDEKEGDQQRVLHRRISFDAARENRRQYRRVAGVPRAERMVWRRVSELATRRIRACLLNHRAQWSVLPACRPIARLQRTAAGIQLARDRGDNRARLARSPGERLVVRA